MGHFLEYVKTCPRWILKNNSFLVNTLDKWPWPVTRKRLHDGVMKKTRGNRKRMSEQWPLTLRTALCPLENGQLSMFNILLANKQCIKLSSNFTEWSRNFMKGEHLALFGDLHLYYLKIGKLPQTSIQIPTWGRRDDPRNQSVITHVLLSDFLRDSLFLVFFFFGFENRSVIGMNCANLNSIACSISQISYNIKKKNCKFTMWYLKQLNFPSLNH